MNNRKKIEKRRRRGGRGRRNRGRRGEEEEEDDQDGDDNVSDIFRLDCGKNNLPVWQHSPLERKLGSYCCNQF